MTTFQKVSIFCARIAIGWLFFYAGITKLLDPDWSAVGYISQAKTFPGFFDFLAGPSMIGITNALNEWGLTLVGIFLMAGVAVRISSILGASMMLLYYLPGLEFPYPNAHAYIIDEHIIYISLFMILAAYKAGDAWGLGNRIGQWFKKYPFIQSILSK